MSFLTFSLYCPLGSSSCPIALTHILFYDHLFSSFHSLTPSPHLQHRSSSFLKFHKPVLSPSPLPVLAIFRKRPNSVQCLSFNISLPSLGGLVPIYLPSASVAQLVSYSERDICTFFVRSEELEDEEGWEEDEVVEMEEVDSFERTEDITRVSQNVLVQSSLHLGGRFLRGRGFRRGDCDGGRFR